MGMSIDLAIKVLKRMIKKGIAYDDGYAFEPLSQDEEKACSIAIDTMNRHQMMQADYEARLKADMVAELEELKYDLYHALCYEIHEKEDCPCTNQTTSCLAEFRVCDANRAIYKVIQQKINALRGEEE